MLKFKEFLLFETLDSKFDVIHNKELKNIINNNIKDKIYPEHTAVMSSDHMNNKGIHVLRMMNKNNEIEYHLINQNKLPGEKLSEKDRDSKTTLHAIKIIHDDAKFHLQHGRKIRIQSANLDQHKIYTSLANHLIKNDPNRKVTQLGYQPRLDGEGNSKTLVVEEKHVGKMNIFKLLRN